ncbi:hypothetical protein DFH07DRAFT_775578 [Mycena maculata]|uniref:Uncharacterized protein n=1 Tax=Mycena maculata TaxID=230809 RepID=A0AAD7IR44_9AGAR|nr:hypothetical protein DFH07DRAFT_775578 [Mycena maculata]
MVSRCHPATLFLNSVWFAFSHLGMEVFGQPNPHIASPSTYIPLAKVLATCPLKDGTSPEFIMLSEMQEMLTQYRISDTHYHRRPRCLLELEPLIDGYENISNPTVFQATVSKTKDFLLPFHEHGPSRVHSRLAGNMFDPIHARTWGGVHLVDEYWRAIRAPGCPNWEHNTQEGMYPFEDCYKFLISSNPSRFREIGDLISFLLTADFVYAGAITRPSVETVGSLIHDVNKGGMKGLEFLELIPPRTKASKGFKKGDKVQVKAGVSRLYDFLDTKLSPVQKVHMVFDVVCLMRFWSLLDCRSKKPQWLWMLLQCFRGRIDVTTPGPVPTPHHSMNRLQSSANSGCTLDIAAPSDLTEVSLSKLDQLYIGLPDASQLLISKVSRLVKVIHTPESDLVICSDLVFEPVLGFSTQVNVAIWVLQVLKLGELVPSTNMESNSLNLTRWRKTVPTQNSLILIRSCIVANFSVWAIFTQALPQPSCNTLIDTAVNVGMPRIPRLQSDHSHGHRGHHTAPQVSGLGPADELVQNNIRVVRDLPLIGKNLLDEHQDRLNASRTPHTSAIRVHQEKLPGP